MKKLFYFFLILFAVPTFSQEDAEMMKAWEAYRTPGDMHKMLANNVGEWKTKISMWMDPAQPPSISEGTVTIEELYELRYFSMKHTTTMMNMPFKGMEIYGYDNAKKYFFSMWIDNMSTGYVFQEGTYDKGTKTIKYQGVSTDVFGKPMKIRQNVTFIDNDTFTTEMFMENRGQEYKGMEITYTRVKK